MALPFSHTGYKTFTCSHVYAEHQSRQRLPIDAKAFAPANFMVIACVWPVPICKSNVFIHNFIYWWLPIYSIY